MVIMAFTKQHVAMAMNKLLLSDSIQGQYILIVLHVTVML